MKEISFFVSGVPRPAGSKSAFALRKNGRPTGQVVVTDSSGKAGKQWRQAVKLHAFNAMKKADMKPFENVALLLRARFFMPRPQKHFLRGEIRESSPTFHTIKPDSTKLTRAIEDAMTGLVYVDDALICHQDVRKQYGERGVAGCQITVEPMLAEIDAGYTANQPPA